MANTGNKIVTILRQRNQTTDTLTGLTKSNLPGDPDYISPVYDGVACTIVTTLVCPQLRAAKSGAAGIAYELSIPASVLANSSFTKMEVVLKDAGASVVDTHSYTSFSPNYFSGTFAGLTTQTYTLDVILKGAAEAVLLTCAAAATVAVTVTSPANYANNAAYNMSIDDVTGTGVPSLPPTGVNGYEEGVHTEIAGSLSIEVSGTIVTTTKLVVYVNGIVVDCLVITAAGTYVLGPVVAAVEDNVLVAVDSGTCDT